MSELPFLISDLALILVVAGITTVIFKFLKQPVVLGYIVAGMIAGPAISLFPSVQDMTNVQTWADIGVLFLLFALGLEFSFKKLVAVGKTGFITAGVQVLAVWVVGFAVGRLMGWSAMTSLFLGGMLSMSSTTIIIKAFDEMGLRRKKFARLVVGVLVVEDLVAVVMMVMLSTIAGHDTFSGWALLTSIFRLVFFLSLWFICGIYLIPTLLKKTRSQLNDETLVVVSVGLCLLMVVLAVKAGFSSALGAFIMGSILAETLDSERIQRLLKPLEDLFGAVFFVSVGMMVDMHIIVQYAWPIVIITLMSLVVKWFSTAYGMYLSGQGMKVSVQSAYSLVQVGEFAFIIAGLGRSLGVTADFLYPVAVAVSVVTTFLTPYMLKLIAPTYGWMLTWMPRPILWGNQRRASFEGEQPDANRQNWRQLLKQYVTNLMITTILSMGIVMLSQGVMEPFVKRIWDGKGSGLAIAAVTLLAMAPFLKAMISNRSKTSGAMMNLWTENRSNHPPIIALTVLKLVIAYLMVCYVLVHFVRLPAWLLSILAFGLLVLILQSKRLMLHYWKLESRFMINLNERQMEDNLRRIEAKRGVREAEDIKDVHWLDRRLYAFSMKVGEESYLIGKSLKELRFRQKFNLIIVRVTRGGEVLNIPSSSLVLEQGDILCFAGRNISFRLLREDYLKLDFIRDSLMTLNEFSHQEEESHGGRLCCSGLPVSDESPICGKTLLESQIGYRQKCLVVGVERKGNPVINPDSDFRLLSGDLVWVLGEEQYVSKLISTNVFGW